MRYGNTLTLVAACLVLAAGAATADAGTITLRSDQDNAINFRSGNGGEFRATFTGTGPWFETAPRPAEVHDFGGYYAGGWQTFCVERDEPMAFNTAYLYTLDTFIRHDTGPDRELAAGTAFLYTEFWNGTLGAGTANAYDYDETDTSSTNREFTARALQLAIWRLQGFGAYEATEYSNSALAQAYVALADSAVAGSWGDTIGNVRVVNIYSRDGTQRQSQLVLVPLPPAAFAGLGLLGGLGLLRLRRRRRTV